MLLGSCRLGAQQAGRGLNGTRLLEFADLQMINWGLGVAEHQLIKLPANKFTVREREMLTGTLGVPQEFFAGGSPWSKVLLGGALCLM